MKDFYSFSLAELEQYLVDNGFKKFAARQIFQGVYKQGKKIEDISNVSKKLKEFLVENTIQEPLKLIEKQTAKDGTTKYLFELKDGQRIETVLMKFAYGYSVCVSTQIGCNMGCKFCASGQIKKIRDLSAGEIVAQVQTVNADVLDTEARIRVSHVVVMGIGEPFDNFDNMTKFIKIINEDIGLCIGKRNITVSTSGVVDRIIDFAKLENQVNLAISLHAPNDEVRSSIMPINNKWSIIQLTDALREYEKISNRRVTIEYIVLDGINDSNEDARELVQLLKGLHVYINLIPYNSVKEGEYKRSPRYEKFGKILRDAGMNVTIRKEKGQDIDAACGQLRAKREV